MYTAILLLLFAGQTEPAAFATKEAPFVGRAACIEWAAQETRRIGRAIEEGADRPEEWQVVCVPLGKERDAALTKR